jgi:pimeloyl-ACP methyl ester carboxylesterase
MASAADGPTRFTVTVQGQGPDVILIPGLATPGAVWDATVTQLAPTHRVHVIRIGGFGGAAAGVNAEEGDILPALVSEVAQYAGTLQRPAIIGPRCRNRTRCRGRILASSAACSS